MSAAPPIGAALVRSLDPAALAELAELLAPYLPDAPTERSPWFDVDEAADYLRCGKQRIYDLTSAGRLPVRKDGSRSLYHRDDLDAYLEG